MMIVSLLDVKNRLEINADDTDHDEQLELWIDSVSAIVEKYLNRVLETGTYTEYFDGNVRLLSVRAIPITSVTSIKQSINIPRDWSGTDAVDSDYYEWDASTGLIHYHYGYFYRGARVIQVVYVGGYASEDSIVQVPAPIKQAVMDQISFYYSNRRNIGLAGQRFGDGSLTIRSPWGLLPGVRDMLDPYRRPPLG